MKGYARGDGTGVLVFDAAEGPHDDLQLLFTSTSEADVDLAAIWVPVMNGEDV